jgi:transcriptional regulator with XRE-family HTH domain
MYIVASQCRAARALLGWSQDELEHHSHITKKTIADFEREARRPHDSSLHALQKAFDSNGVVFIPQNGGGAGVRLKIALPRFFRRSDLPDRG